MSLADDLDELTGHRPRRRKAQGTPVDTVRLKKDLRADLDKAVSFTSDDKGVLNAGISDRAAANRATARADTLSRARLAARLRKKP